MNGKAMALDKQFAVLHLTPTATPAEVRRAYRKLLMVWHPDRFARSDSAKKQEAHKRTMQLIAAYTVLREHFRTRRVTRSETQQAPPTPRTEEPKPAPRPRTHALQARKSLLDELWMVVGMSVLLGGLADLLLWLLIKQL